jgi:signal transduction histidine kinase
MLRDISLHILDLTQNSIRAKAERVDIGLSADSTAGLLSVTIEDNGCGMSKAFLAAVEDPFTTSRTTRKVGMGIPFFKLACVQSGGDFTIDSEEGKGTKLSGTMGIDSIDRLPLGNLGDSVKFLIMGSPEVRFVLTLSADGREAVIDTDEIKAQLGDVSIAEREILEWIEDFINENVANIFGGVLNEIIRRA